MPAKVVSTLQGHSYSVNYEFLKKGLNRDKIEFQVFKNQNQEFDFEHGRTYDFVRSAGAKIRDAMTDYLTDILPNIDEDAQQDLESVFENVFNYSAYKNRLKYEGQRVGKSLKLFIFNSESRFDEEDYVADVHFSCNTIKGEGKLYTVYTSITSKKYTWFEFQEEDLLHSFGCLNLADD